MEPNKKKSRLMDRNSFHELEVLKMIIEDHPGLKHRILDKIRMLKALGSESIAESLERKKKDEAKKQKK
ncbi:MAG: hypothetical protein R3B45_18395 [Bdellovibrionota bacterium]